MRVVVLLGCKKWTSLTFVLVGRLGHRRWLRSDEVLCGLSSWMGLRWSGYKLCLWCLVTNMGWLKGGWGGWGWYLCLATLKIVGILCWWKFLRKAALVGRVARDGGRIGLEIGGKLWSRDSDSNWERDLCVIRILLDSICGWDLVNNERRTLTKRSAQFIEIHLEKIADSHKQQYPVSLPSLQWPIEQWYISERQWQGCM